MERRRRSIEKKGRIKEETRKNKYKENANGGREGKDGEVTKEEKGVAESRKTRGRENKGGK